ncbi:putative Outer membrane protein assembly factor BamB [Pillotina sp. SPG140]|jgi:outer membrane protein assembly factor BamB
MKKALVFCMGVLSIHMGVAQDTTLWQQSAGGVIVASPIAQFNSVVVVTDGGNVKAYSAQGEALWNYFAGGKLSSFVGRSPEGTVYVSRDNGTLIAVSWIGEELWQAPMDGPLAYPVVYGWDGRIFAATAQSVYCFTANGRFLWHQEFDTAFAIKPMAVRGGIVAVSLAQELVHIDPFGVVTKEQLSEIPSLIIPLESGRLVFFSPSGAVTIHGVEEQPIEFPALPAPPLAGALYKNHVALALQSGQIALLSLNDGNLVWTVDGHVRPAGSGGTIIYDERGIATFSPSGAAGFTEDGTLQWALDVQDTPVPPTLGNDGILYSGGNNWMITAYRVQKRRGFFTTPPIPTYGLGTFPIKRSSYAIRLAEWEVTEHLQAIDTTLKSGTLGEEEKQLSGYLMEVAASFQNSVAVLPSQPPVHLRNRIRATLLLSDMGSGEMMRFLVDIFFREPEPLVRVAAAEAMGRIGIDRERHALTAFKWVLRPSYRLRDEQILMAMTIAIGNICRYSGPSAYAAGIELLNILSMYDKPVAVRKRAEQELEKIWTSERAETSEQVSILHAHEQFGQLQLQSPTLLN